MSSATPKRTPKDRVAALKKARPGQDARRRAGDERLPPGQVLTQKWPVLHHGSIPAIDPASWTLTVTGLVEKPFAWTWEGFRALPQIESTSDIHCVTRWSRYDTTFEGVAVEEILRRVGPRPEVRHVIVHAAGHYTTNLPFEDFDRPENLFAHSADGAPLTPEHGAPVRLVVPHLYFWKSAKWVTGIELVSDDRPGFWESVGYHNYGDPWREQRFSGD